MSSEDPRPPPPGTTEGGKKRWTFSGITSTIGTVLSSAAKATANYSKSVYNDMSSFPESVKCHHPGCRNLIVVPPSFWEWTCPLSHVNSGGATTCATPGCTALRPAYPADRTITCPLCQNEAPVPTSKAKNMAVSASVYVKNGVHEARQKAQQVGEKPKATECSNPECKRKLEVPAGAWFWKCGEDHENADSREACAFCADKKRIELPAKVTCRHCQEENIIPRSEGRLFAAKAGQAAKRLGQATAKSMKALPKAPDSFNCEYCGTLLMVPAPQPWMCEIAGCGTVNPADTALCTICGKKKVPKVVCGQCRAVVVVPSTNLETRVRSLSITAKRGFESARNLATNSAPSAPDGGASAPGGTAAAASAPPEGVPSAPPSALFAAAAAADVAPHVPLVKAASGDGVGEGQVEGVQHQSLYPQLHQPQQQQPKQGGDDDDDEDFQEVQPRLLLAGQKEGEEDSFQFQSHAGEGDEEEESEAKKKKNQHEHSQDGFR